MSQPTPVHCWCRILREAGGGDAKCGPCLVRENAALKARLAAQEHLNEPAVKAALHASQARLYPDAAYEKYLDELSVSLADLVGDAEPDSLDDAALRQAADAISHLRRTRDELRRDLNNVALAALPPSSPVADSPTWQPIETAPKHDRVLIWSRKSGAVGIYRWCDYELHNEGRFTHWMPLPSAPSPSAGAAKENKTT